MSDGPLSSCDRLAPSVRAPMKSDPGPPDGQARALLLGKQDLGGLWLRELTSNIADLTINRSAAIYSLGLNSPNTETAAWADGGQPQRLTRIAMDQSMPSDTGATRFVSMAMLIMLVVLVSLLYLKS